MTPGAEMPAQQDLGWWMNERRKVLDLRWQDVADLAAISRQTLNNIRDGGRQPQELTKAAIERALQWRPGAIDAVLRGGQPRALDEADDTASSEEIVMLDPDPAKWTPAAVLRVLSAFARQRPEDFFRTLYDIADVHRKVTGQDTIDPGQAAAS